MYAIRGLDDYNFTPEEAEDKALFDEAEVNSYQACDIALEEKTTQVSEDTAGKSMGDMFEPNAEALRVFAEIDTDGSGFLDAKELKRAYRLQGPLILFVASSDCAPLMRSPHADLSRLTALPQRCGLTQACSSRTSSWPTSSLSMIQMAMARSAFVSTAPWLALTDATSDTLATDGSDEAWTTVRLTVLL